LRALLDELGAGDRVRTGDVQLGRLTLYQLSYSRELRRRSAPAAKLLRRFRSCGLRQETSLLSKVEGDGFEPSKA
jgi:hypothetical protein